MVASGVAPLVASGGAPLVALIPASIHTPALFLLYHKNLAITWTLFLNLKSSQRMTTKKGENLIPPSCSYRQNIFL